MERYTQDLEMALHRQSPSFNRPPGYISPLAESQNNDNTFNNSSAGDIYADSFEDRPPPVPPRPNRADRPSSTYSRVDVHLQPGDPIPETRDEDVVAIRETLYAVLADVLSQSKTLGYMLRADPARG